MKLLEGIERKHRWWHWWFESYVSVPYRFSVRWHGSVVEYQKVYCSLCKRVVRQRYTDAELRAEGMKDG